MSMGQKASAKDISKSDMSKSQVWGTTSLWTESAGKSSASVSPASAISTSLRKSSTSRTEEVALTDDVDGLDGLEEFEVGNEAAPMSTLERRFNLFIGVLIILNVIVIALETDYGYDDADEDMGSKVGWVIVDSFFIVAFLAEIGVRIYWERWNWPRSGWNWFDCIIIFLAILDIWILSWVTESSGGLQVMSVFRIIRLIRLVRLVKLVRLLRGLYVIVLAMWHAMQTMSFLLAIMAFGLLIYSIFAVTIIGRNPNLDNVRINGTDTVYDRFGTVFRSMYSLFELMTLEGWEAVARPIVEEEPWLFLFIVSYIMIFTFGMLNMIVATVIEKTLHHTRMLSDSHVAEERRRMKEELIRIRTMFDQSHQDSSGKMTFQEFEVALKENPSIREIFNKMGISLHDAKELYTVLDWDDSGDLTIKEFLSGISKLQDGVCSPWDALATHAIVRNNRNKITELHGDFIRSNEEAVHWRTNVEKRLEKQNEVLQDVFARLGFANNNQ
mmetsp:Transcript_27153/g.53096  ORF Transcript_27153/g.53096 Transcript_27153/m.53096 type:complete len:499 (+) Transcript_27153:21-1517(+)